MSEDAISNVLLTVLIIMILVLMILLITYVAIRFRNKERKKEIKVDKKNKEKQPKKNDTNTSYNKQSIFNFMEFEKIEDNMIIQKKGKRYLMIVECQGVNYDLMSSMEKVGIEEGFQQFLNTLRHPIQIYIQTRTINLEKSISTYTDKVKQIEDKYRNMVFEYNKMIETGTYSKSELDKYLYEVTKQRNMLEYGRDILNDTQKMSLNRSVLNKKYYIVIPYYFEEVSAENYTVEEIRNIAFSELYTKAQSIIRTLSSCSVSGKILSSKDLIDLLYVAYNRDESEVYGINRALKAEYDDLYSTSQDIYEKKVQVLDKEIEEKAIEKANRAIEKAKSTMQQRAEEREDNLEELIRKMAQIVIEDNKEYVGPEIADQAVEEINKEEDEVNEEVKKTTRGRKKASTKQ